MHYVAEQWPGVAVYVSGHPDDDDLDGWVYVTMVGDDRRHLVEFDTLSPLDDDAYCSVCGQLGCAADGRSNE